MASSRTLRAEKTEKVNKRGILVKRKEKVDKIIYDINSKTDGFINAVNDKILYCVSMFSEGLSGRKGEIGEQIWQEKEKDSDTDGSILGVKEKLIAESNRCGAEIEALNSEISALGDRIRSAERREEAEREELERQQREITNRRWEEI